MWLRLRWRLSLLVLCLCLQASASLMCAELLPLASAVARGGEGEARRGELRASREQTREEKREAAPAATAAEFEARPAKEAKEASLDARSKLKAIERSQKRGESTAEGMEWSSLSASERAAADKGTKLKCDAASLSCRNRSRTRATVLEREEVEVGWMNSSKEEHNSDRETKSCRARWMNQRSPAQQPVQPLLRSRWSAQSERLLLSRRICMLRSALGLTA